MNYYIYKIINKITGHYYIGCRMTKLNIHEDEYFGSGVGLKAAIKKYGKENFYKVIMCQCENREEMYETESGFVTEELVNLEECYNLHPGGKGGSMPGVIRGPYKTRSDKGKKRGCSDKLRTAIDKLADSRRGISVNLSEETRKKLSDAGKKGGAKGLGVTKNYPKNRKGSKVSDASLST